MSTNNTKKFKVFYFRKYFQRKQKKTAQILSGLV
nr:MAG TPA: hypothetical protein [Caudoviricetes sp.]